MEWTAFLAFAVACIVIAVVPGPAISLIVARSVRHGPRAGLTVIAGTQVGIGFFVLMVVLGYASLIEFVGKWFEILRLIGAAYLIWLGVRMIFLARSRPKVAEVTNTSAKTTGYAGIFLEGVLVALTNPKTLLFISAFIPQFVDPAATDSVWTFAALGLFLMVILALIDSMYALASGIWGARLSGAGSRLIEKFTGTFLIGGGLWLAFSRN